MRPAPKAPCAKNSWRASPGNNRHFNTRGQRAADTIAIADVKRFQLLAVITHIDKPVG